MDGPRIERVEIERVELDRRRAEAPDGSAGP